ncbi:hypothetical protein [Echinicola pacifica]|uniref:hypothetical protein n=1 Tax=Echinicola pacifica TaxID=346377 RepID=UPI0012F96380|nr:hypothetical protein [Echinicola pacifica]
MANAKGIAGAEMKGIRILVKIILHLHSLITSRPIGIQYIPTWMTEWYQHPKQDIQI